MQCSFVQDKSQSLVDPAVIFGAIPAFIVSFLVSFFVTFAAMVDQMMSFINFLWKGDNYMHDDLRMFEMRCVDEYHNALMV